MYSQKLQELKEFNLYDAKNATFGFGIDKDRLVELVKGFGTTDDVIHIPHDQLFDLFDQYCAENGCPSINRITLGRVFCEVFGIQRKKAYINKRLCWIYEKKK